MKCLKRRLRLAFGIVPPGFCRLVFGSYEKIMEANSKRCSVCKEIKNLSLFGVRKKAKDGRNYRCKVCQSKSSRDSRSRNPMATQVGTMIKKAKERSALKKLPFDIDFEYLLDRAPSHCPIFNMPLEWSCFRSEKKGPLPNSPSLDRIVPDLGYVKGNVWIISHRANTIKSNATHEELKLVAEAVGKAIIDSQALGINT